MPHEKAEAPKNAEDGTHMHDTGGRAHVSPSEIAGWRGRWMARPSQGTENITKKIQVSAERPSGRRMRKRPSLVPYTNPPPA